MHSNAKRLLIACCVIGFAGLGLYIWWTPINASDPSTIVQAVAERGTRIVTLELEDTDNWDTIISNVKTGDERWIRVIGPLTQGNNVHMSEELIEAASAALLINPSGFLRHADEMRLDLICGLSSDEDEVARQKRALASVVDPALVPAKESCFKQIEINQSYFKAR